MALETTSDARRGEPPLPAHGGEAGAAEPPRTQPLGDATVSTQSTVSAAKRSALWVGLALSTLLLCASPTALCVT